MLLIINFLVERVLSSAFLDILCKEQMRFQVLDIGEWVRFPETIHEFYAHLAEMIGKMSFLFSGDMILISLFLNNNYFNL